MKASLPSDEEKWIEARQRLAIVETELGQTAAELKLTQEKLHWTAAFLEAQANSSIDAVIVVDARGKKILQNERTADLFKIPPHIASDENDEEQVRWVAGMTKNPEEFAARVAYLYSHPNEISRDEIELKDGTIIDRYSSPVSGNQREYYGRIWTFRDITEQRRVEQDLKEAKIAAVVWEGAQRYNFLADTVPLILWTAHPDGCLDYYNKAWFDYTGLTLAQTEDWGWGAVIHPDDLLPCIGRWTHSFTTGEDYEIEYRFKRGAEGTYRWFLGRASARRNEAGEIVQWVGTCTDIDDQKRVHSELESRVADRTAELAKTNEALQRQHAELRVLFDLMPAMICFKDTENRILKVNQRGADASGKSVEEIEGKPTLEVYPEKAAAYYAEDLEVIRSGAPKLGMIEALRDRDGAEHWIQTDRVPYCDASGKVVGIVVMAQDITERRRDEEKLRESKRFAESIAENSTSIIYLYDLETHRSVYSNRNAAEALGYSQARIAEMGENFLPRMAHPDDLPGIMRQHAHFAEVTDSRIFDLEFRLRDASGDWHWMWARETVFLRRPNGAAWQILGTAQDITQRKQLEAQLFQSQKMETVGKLAGGIAHEFNSILTAIIGQCELLLGDLPTGSPAARNAGEINKAAGRAATLTRQLLAYGRKQFLQPETLDLNQVIANMDGMLHHLMGGDVDTQIVPAPGLRAVRADAGQFEQVIVNMSINAREAMPNGGKLTLETANVSFDEESVGRDPELKPGDYVMLAITDTGAGMSSDVKARLFEPFSSTKDVGQGIGLGLATCYGIIKQSGGHISAYSEPGRGTTFKIYLPQVEPEKKIPAQRLDAPGLARGTESILLVEDEPALREMAATLLRRLGYTVVAAASGLEALNLTQQQGIGHIDLLLTDVVMPHMSGRELADRVRALSPHTRILFTSAYTENAIVHQGVLDKGAAMLPKPFTPSALAHKLREVLDQPRAPEPGAV